MTKINQTPEQERTKQAECANRFLGAVSGIAVVLLLIGVLLASSCFDLLAWLSITVWVVLVVMLIAFVRGAKGGQRHG